MGGGSNLWKGNVKVYKENEHDIEEVDKKMFFSPSQSKTRSYPMKLIGRKDE